MDTAARKLRRAQLDRAFHKVRGSLEDFSVPRDGWINTIREALGMSMVDLASRMGVIKQRVGRLEKDEINGKVTLETMKKTAEALGCEFVYAIVPKGSLDEAMRLQAGVYVDEVIKTTQQTMALEKQGLKNEGQSFIKKNLIEEVLLKNEKQIWKIK